MWILFLSHVHLNFQLFVFWCLIEQKPIKDVNKKPSKYQNVSILIKILSYFVGLFLTKKMILKCSQHLNRQVWLCGKEMSPLGIQHSFVKIFSTSPHEGKCKQHVDNLSLWGTTKQLFYPFNLNSRGKIKR